MANSQAGGEVQVPGIALKQKKHPVFFFQCLSLLLFFFFKHLKSEGWVVGCVQREEGVKAAHAGVGRVLMADAGNMVCLLQCLHYCSSVCGRKEMTRLGFKPLH